MIPALDSADGRRAWAFIAILGGCMVFTVFAAVGVWLVSAMPGLSFWLALAAHVQILVGMTALGWAMGRRMELDVSRTGAKMKDSIDAPAAAQLVADEAQAAADTVKDTA